MKNFGFCEYSTLEVKVVDVQGDQFSVKPTIPMFSEDDPAFLRLKLSTEGSDWKWPATEKLAAATATAFTGEGQCEKNSQCIRGFKHGGKGGRCSLAKVGNEVATETVVLEATIVGEEAAKDQCQKHERCCRPNRHRGLCKIRPPDGTYDVNHVDGTAEEEEEEEEAEDGPYVVCDGSNFMTAPSKKCWKLVNRGDSEFEEQDGKRLKVGQVR